jgi:hypothetical protein
MNMGLTVSAISDAQVHTCNRSILKPLKVLQQFREVESSQSDDGKPDSRLAVKLSDQI